MQCETDLIVTDVIGAIPYRMAFAGGWIDQPFVSRHNPDPPGSMVVVGLEPTFWCLERAGMATGTRKIALDLWDGVFPDREPIELVKKLYAAENQGKPEPSGSQDMIGLVYPGVNRLDFDYDYEGGLFPKHIESNNDPRVARWLEKVIYMVPIAQRPDEHNPLGVKNLDPQWIRRLGQTGRDCFDAILGMDVSAFGAAMNDCMECWEAILPNTVRHETVKIDLAGSSSITSRSISVRCIPAAAADTCTSLPTGRYRADCRSTCGMPGRPSSMNRVLVVGSFDNLNAYHMRLLQEAAGLGSVHVLLWSDELIHSMEGRTPKLPQEERKYFVEAVRYVDDLTMVESPVHRNAIPAQDATAAAIWVVDQPNDSPAKRAFCDVHRMRYHVLEEAELQGYPEPTCDDAIGGSHDQKKVIVTGCYDWFHTGHVRFFEEVAQLGDLYVVVGHDDNIRLLKGEGHPMCSEEMRRYMAGSIRHVKKALVSSGHGWLDAEPEIELIQPDIYAVNEDGDQPEKRKYCEEHGIEYQILKRLPKEGLPIRRSTDLRGF